MTGAGATVSSLSRHLTLARSASGPQPAGETDWLAVLTLANAHVLAPTLYQRMLAGGRERELPEDARDYLAMLLHLNEQRNARLRDQATEIIAGFNAAGIRPILLKGAVTLFDGDDSSRRSRMMRDLDLLVPRRKQEAAVKALYALGYTVHERYPRDHHAYGEFAREGAPGTVDLHTELIDPDYLLPAAELYSTARPLEVDGSYAAVPSPTHRVLHHLLHAQLHHLGHFYRGELMLNQVYELAVLNDRLGSTIDWQSIARRLAEHRLTAPLHSYLLVTQRLFAMPWPLSSPPAKRAEVHAWRCLLQLRYPGLSRWLVPFGNLRRSYAWHRMNALYGGADVMAAGRLKHTIQFLRKKSVRQAVERVFRFDL